MGCICNTHRSVCVGGQGHQGHVQGSGLDLLEVLEVEIHPLRGLLQGQLLLQSQRPYLEPQRSCFAGEVRRLPVSPGRSLVNGTSHEAQPSVHTSHVSTSHVAKCSPLDTLRRNGRSSC
jgi:hypothetical protein